jgi:hypothetical protein
MVMSRLLSFLLCAGLFVTGCGGGSAAPASDAGGTSGQDASASGGNAAAGADGGGAAAGSSGEAAAPIGLSDKNLNVSALDDEAALKQLVGVYDVAIFFSEKGKESGLGAAKLDVAYDGDKITLTLKKPAGSTIVKVENSRKMPVMYGQATFFKVLNKILVDQRDSPFERIDVTLAVGGFISGYVGGSGQFFHFRNNLVHYGTTPPAHLIAQAGTWSGPQLALTCDRPPVTVVVTQTAGVTLTGKANLDCMPAEVTNQWDGQDDFVAPGSAAGTVDVVLDSANRGGSAPPGGIKVTVGADSTVAGIKEARTALAGARGNLEVQDPQRQ